MHKRKLFLSLAFLSTLLLSSCSIFSNGGNSDQTSNDNPVSTVDSSDKSTNPVSDSTEPEQSQSSSSSSQSTPTSSNQSSSSSASSQSQPSRSSQQPGGQEGFSNITEFNSPVEIHTAEQKTYLSYTGNYAQMPENQYPDGSVHKSDSLPVNLSWNYTAPSGKTVSNYSFISGQKADLSDGYTITTTNKSLAYYNPYLGRNYFKLVANFSDGTKDETAIRTFDVDTTYPRNLAIGGMTNCRDMGGRTLEDGGKMKQGLIYRTSGFKYDYSTEITEAGKKEMLQHLKVKTEVNVADGSNYNLKLSGTTVKEFKMDYSGGSHHFSRNAESVKNFFNLLSDSNNYPVYFHCRIGTDRTGLCAILLSGLLGVSLNEIYQDYLFSNFGKIGEKRYIGAAAGADNIQNYISDIQNMSGKTFKNKVYNMLLAIGVSRNTLDTIISNLTEGQTAKDNDAGQIIAPANLLTGNGTTVKTDTSDRNNPDNYFVLNSSSQSVSYSFTTAQDFRGQVVAYLGNGDSSSSKKIADAIGCSLDNAAIAMKDQSYSDARMGKCGSRTNYYPVILGEVDIPAGSHSIKLTGTSNSMNVGGIYIFDAANGTGGGQQQGGGGEQEHTSHNYVAQTPVTNKAGKQVTTYLCSCGKKYIDIKFSDYSSIDGVLGSDGKIGGTNKVKTTLKWDIPAKAGEVKLQFNMKMSSGVDSHKNHQFDNTLYSLKINGVTQTILLENGKTYSQLGLTTSGQYFDIANYNIENDTNLEIEFVHNNSDYRLLFTENVRLFY